MFYIKKIRSSDLYYICNKYNLFTCGSSEQYQKMFELASKGITKKELAYILYLCSNNSLTEIMDIIHPLFKDDTIYN